MYTAGAKVILDFFNNEELAEKTRRLSTLMKDVRRKFAVSINEVADFDDPERCVLGIALCAATRAGADKAIKAVLEYIDTHSVARVLSEESEIVAFD
ncbi:MAG: DUF503 family protein [Deltaproteobacteria bacterium]|nr:DUF503 family protein [Deltaproteobacteria bacterium]